MTVQELFKQVLNTKKSKEDFCRYYLRYVDNNLKGKNKKQKLLKLIDDICECKDIKQNNDCIVFFVPNYPEKDCTDYTNNFLIHKADLFKEENIIDSTKMQPYSYEFQPMKEILGYKASSACIYAFGCHYMSLASILWEMTWLGYDIREQEQNSIKELKELNNAVQEIQTCPETSLISWDKMKLELTEKPSIKPKDNVIFEEMFDEQYCQTENIFYNKVFDLLCQLERNYIRNEQRN